MTNEIKPERIEELLHWLRKLDNGNTVTGILKAGELRTLIRVYQRVRGLPERFRDIAALCGAEGFQSAAGAWDAAGFQLDRAIRGEEG